MQYVTLYYKQHTIERGRVTGMYSTFGEYSGRYLIADTIKGIKKLIDEDIQSELFFTNHG